MPFRCVLFASRDAVLAEYRVIPVGAMWPAPDLLAGDDITGMLGTLYGRDWLGKRPPMVLMLPNGIEMCIDGRAYSRLGGYHGDGWQVMGEVPNITIVPSIVAGRTRWVVAHGVLSEVGRSAAASVKC